MQTIERITATELKALTGEKSLTPAIYSLYTRLKRRTWQTHCNGETRTFEPSGINWKDHYILLCSMWSSGENAVSYRYARVPLAEAMDCITGNFSPEYLR